MEKDVNEDPIARSEFSKLNIKGVPAFLIDDQVIVGLDIGKIEALLDYTVISCKKCSSRMRVPKNKGKLRITCKNCEYQFIMAT
ncbi:hypothetical protein SAMN03080606_03604 [Alkaliphilus peptidifermentans DSM 18978]|uniref:Glutaredoxin n=1 Tax=Alkaliphilus peptidifermentans DSM 18978 TaxID=1120976 RepID=A0A1G5KNT6_9FIRM|nr:hypothetical protein SAMN03080606_03604 [Alkaliphilus peptidifermentans DSM 18978]